MSELSSERSTPKSDFGWRQLFAWGAWQPVTGGGIARFAAASGVRTLTLQVVYSAMVAAVALWAFRQAWFPAINQALPRLPVAEAEIRGGRLTWPDTEAHLLSERPQLSVSVDPSGTGESGRSGDLQVEFRQRGLRLEGLFGHQELPYPPEFQLPLDRTGATAAWGAWSWPILAVAGMLAGALVLILGWVVATLLTLPVFTLAWMLGRNVTVAGAWRMGLAAGLAGWGFFGLGLVLYATAWIRLPGLAAALLAQMLTILIWSLWALFHLPRRTRTGSAVSGNPFGAKREAGGKGSGRDRSNRGNNPFQ